MKYTEKGIVFQEVPNEVSLYFYISWCNLRCENCHSKEYWNWNIWEDLTIFLLLEEIHKYKNYITCAVFFWWEWQPSLLSSLLTICKANWLKTCLYTWLYYEMVPNMLLRKLDYIKYWPYKEELWWLTSPTTNQVFLNLNTWEDLTHLFYDKYNN